MSASLIVNLALLVAAGALLVWFPDRLTLVPLILSKVHPPAESVATTAARSGTRRGTKRERSITRKKPTKKKANRTRGKKR